MKYWFFICGIIVMNGINYLVTPFVFKQFGFFLGTVFILFASFCGSVVLVTITKKLWK